MKAPKIKKYVDGTDPKGVKPSAAPDYRGYSWKTNSATTDAERAAYLEEVSKKGYAPLIDSKNPAIASQKMIDTNIYEKKVDPSTGNVRIMKKDDPTWKPSKDKPYEYIIQDYSYKSAGTSPEGTGLFYQYEGGPKYVFADGKYVPYTAPVAKANGGGVKAPFVKKKVAKYAGGTPVGGVQYDENNNPVLSSQNTLGGSEIQTTGQSNFYQGYNRNVVDTTGADSQKKQGNGGKQITGQAAGALGSYDNNYYANQQGSGNENEDARSAVLGGVSKMGQIGAVISGAAAIGDQIGAKKKAEAEEFDAEGNLKNEGKAQRSAISGSLFSPSKALSARGSYKGGFTDFTGKGYTQHLEAEKKKEINQQATSDALAARDSGETMATANFAEPNKEPEKAWKNQAAGGALIGGFVGGPAGIAGGASTGLMTGAAKDKKLLKFKAEGGTIVGAGGPKDDAILSKVGKNGIEAGSFITPAENNHLAKAIRAKVLGDNPNKVAQFKKEGGEMKADVAVSNGEHLFTPKEKRKIMSHLGKEILEELAPNAEDEDKMNCGGKVKYAKGTPKGGVQKRTNSTGVSSVDKMIDDAYTNPPKTEKEWNDMVSKIKTLTRGRSSKDVNNFVTFANDNINRIKKSDEESYAKNKKLAEQGGDIVSNIKKLKELGASDKLIKQYTDDAKGLSGKESGFARNKTPNELFTYYRDRAEDEDISKNKENVKKGLDERVQANYKKLQDAKNNPQNYTPEQIEKIQSDFDSSAEYRDKLVGDIDKNDIKAYREAKSILSKKGSKSFPESEPAIKKGSKSFPESEPAIKKGSDLEDIKQSPADKLGGGKEYVMPTNLKDRGRGVSAPKIGGVKSSTVKGVEFSPKIAEEETSYPSVATEQGQPVIEATEFYKKPLNDTQADLLVKSAQSVKPETPKPETEKTGIGKYLGKNYGSLLETGAALGQLGMGLKATREQRPVDVIDPQFLANVNKAQAEAKYGFTAEENSLMDQERQQALNAARFAARNYSGGSPASAFNMERAAINDSYGSALKKAIANKSLQMSKQQYADAMSAQKAGMSRQLFNDKMNAWMQNQQAGGNLIGAGIRNIIGASRYQQELKAQQERNKYNNPGF